MGFLIKWKENIENLARIKLKNGSIKYGLILCETNLQNKDLILLVTSYSKDLQIIESEFLYVDEISEIDIREFETESDGEIK